MSNAISDIQVWGVLGLALLAFVLRIWYFVEACEYRQSTKHEVRSTKHKAKALPSPLCL
jgi:hypothetical protein